MTDFPCPTVRGSGLGRSRILGAVLALAAAALGGSIRAAPAAAGPAGPSKPELQEAGVDALDWLAGCWESKSPERVLEEVWMPPRGGSLLGMSRSLREEGLAGYEFLLLTERDGHVWYRAHPSGQPITEFRATRVGDGVLTVENPSHDFPRRIEYRAQGRDSLLAWIDGGPGDEGTRIEFRFARAVCAG